MQYLKLEALCIDFNIMVNCAFQSSADSSSKPEPERWHPLCPLAMTAASFTQTNPHKTEARAVEMDDNTVFINQTLTSFRLASRVQNEHSPGANYINRVGWEQGWGVTKYIAVLQYKIWVIVFRYNYLLDRCNQITVTSEKYFRLPMWLLWILM